MFMQLGFFFLEEEDLFQTLNMIEILLIFSKDKTPLSYLLFLKDLHFEREKKKCSQQFKMVSFTLK